MPIKIVAHKPTWSQSFQAESNRLTALLHPWLAGPIEHVGSTAVPGLAAKPIIDMAAPIRSLDAADDAVPLLEQHGYMHWKDDPGRAWRHWLLTPSPEARTHHVYLMERREPEWYALLAFRDHLRKNPEDAAEYARTKHRLASRFPDDREAYTAGKTAFLRSVFDRLGLRLPHPRDASYHPDR